MTLALLSNRGLHKRPGGWSPAELGSSLKMWFDADDATTITLSGSKVSQWNDKSGNANHVTQTSSSIQPTWSKNAQNGRAAIDFGGACDLRNTFSYTGSILTTFAVVKVMTGLWQASARVVSMATANAGDSDYAGSAVSPLLRRQTQANVATIFNNTWYGTTGVSNNTWYVLGSVINGTSFLFSKDGTTATATTSTPSFAITKMRIGNDATDDVSGGWNAPIAEVVILTSAISTTDRPKLEGYLAHKWGLTGSLPAGHAHKNAAP